MTAPDLAAIGRVAGVLAVGAGVGLGMWLGTAVRFPDTGAAILFPPYAVLTAALLLTPRARWWAPLLAAFVAQVAVGHPRAPAYVTAVFAMADWLRALIAVGLLRRLGQATPRFDTLEGAAVFLLVVGVAAPAAGAAVGAGAFVVLAPRGPVDVSVYGRVWVAWFLSNALTGVMLLPPLLAAARGAHGWFRGLTAPGGERLAVPRLDLLGRPRHFEVVLFVGALLAVAVAPALAPVGGPATVPLRLYAPLPLFLWAAMRFGPGATSLTLLVVAVSTVYDVAQGRGPLAGPVSDGHVAGVYTFLAAAIVPALLLAALVREREHMLAGLSEAQRRYRLAASAGGVGVWDWTPARDELYIDPALKAMLGHADHEVPNTMAEWRRRVHPDDGARVVEAAGRALQAGAPGFEAEQRVRHRDGSTRWFLTRAAVVPAADGGAARVVGTATDITERKQAQEALRESEARMAMAAAAARLGFWGMTPDGGPPGAGRFWLSDHARRLWGLPGGAEPTLDDLAARAHPDDRDAARAAFEAAAAGGGGFEEEFRVLRPGGEVCWLRAMGRPAGAAAGAPAGSAAAAALVGVVVDVTGRKQAELDAEARRRELAHLGRVSMLGQLSGAIAHELRQPLTAILSNAQAAQRFLARTPPDLDEVRAILADIAADDARAGEVIARLRRMLEKGAPRLEPVSLNRVVDAALAISRSDLAARGVAVTRELDAALPAVHGDEVALQQVLVNLVVNACDAMRDLPPPRRRLTVRTGRDADGAVLAAVVDRGTGIPPERLEQVFEPFATTKADGLGLGLAICRSLVTSHGGRLWAANNPDGGATFSLALPPGAPGEAGGRPDA